MPQLLLATHNPGKIRLFSEVFATFGFECIDLAQAGIGDTDVEENATTPEGNALLKAQAAWTPGLFVFADDAGLEIDALNGEPGVQTRRWNGRFPNDVDDEIWLDYLLSRLDGVPLSRRTAKFVSGWALIGPQGEQGVRRILTPFTIAMKRIRPMIAGFPLSAVSISSAPETASRAAALIKEMAKWEFFQILIFRYGVQPAVQSSEEAIPGQY